MAQGLDYSFSHPALTCAAQGGYSFVARYIGDPDPNSAKYLDADELVAIRAAGLSLCVARETTAGFMLTDSGAVHARVSRAHCNQLGLWGIPIYYALDVDPRPLSAVQLAAMIRLGAIPRDLSDEKREAVLEVFAQVRDPDIDTQSMEAEMDDLMGPQADAVTRFLQDAADADGGGHNVGIYGSDDAIDRWARQPFCWWGWQTYAWSGGRVSPNAHFRQYLNGQNVCGGTVDLNETYAADYGQWPRPSAPPPPPPDPRRAEMLYVDVNSGAYYLGGPGYWVHIGDPVAAEVLSRPNVYGPPEGVNGPQAEALAAAYTGGTTGDDAELDAITAAILASRDAIVAGVVAALPPGSGLTVAQVQGACEAGVRSVLGGLDA